MSRVKSAGGFMSSVPPVVIGWFAGHPLTDRVSKLGGEAENVDAFSHVFGFLAKSVENVSTC
jgi:hypothetical protein